MRKDSPVKRLYISATLACLLGAASPGVAQQPGLPTASPYAAQSTADYYFQVGARQASPYAPQTTGQGTVAAVSPAGHYIPQTAAAQPMQRYPLHGLTAGGAQQSQLASYQSRSPNATVYTGARLASTPTEALPPGIPGDGQGAPMMQTVPGHMPPQGTIVPPGAENYLPPQGEYVPPAGMQGGSGMHGGYHGGQGYVGGQGGYYPPAQQHRGAAPMPQSSPTFNPYDSGTSAGFPPSTMYGGASHGGAVDSLGSSYGGAYEGAMGSECCGACEPCYDMCDSRRWFGSLAALYIMRENPNGVPLSSFESDANAFDYQWGGEARLGRVIGSRFAVETVYWTFETMDESLLVANPGNARLDFAAITIDGTNLGGIYNGSSQHYLRRRNEVHNAELNFLTQPMGNIGSRYGNTLFAGTRYFRFDEGLTFSAAAAGTNFGAAAGTLSGMYDVDVLNELMGGQFGVRSYVYLMPSLKLHASPSFGVYWNKIEHRSQITLGNRQSGLDITSKKDECALMGQLDVGLTYELTQRWSVFAAYRALAASNVALSDDQIPLSVTDRGDIIDIDSKGSLILHGALAGVQYYW